MNLESKIRNFLAAQSTVADDTELEEVLSLWTVATINSQKTRPIDGYYFDFDNMEIEGSDGASHLHIRVEWYMGGREYDGQEIQVPLEILDDPSNAIEKIAGYLKDRK